MMRTRAAQKLSQDPGISFRRFLASTFTLLAEMEFAKSSTSLLSNTGLSSRADRALSFLLFASTRELRKAPPCREASLVDAQTSVDTIARTGLLGVCDGASSVPVPP